MAAVVNSQPNRRRPVKPSRFNPFLAEEETPQEIEGNVSALKVFIPKHRRGRIEL